MVQARLTALALLFSFALLSPDVPPAPPEEPVTEDEQWQRFSTSCSGSSLRTQTVAEADFRANDRDWDHVNDFWTVDVKGLYTMTGAAEQPE